MALQHSLKSRSCSARSRRACAAPPERCDAAPACRDQAATRSLLILSAALWPGCDTLARDFRASTSSCPSTDANASQRARHTRTHARARTHTRTHTHTHTTWMDGTRQHEAKRTLKPRQMREGSSREHRLRPVWCTLSSTGAVLASPSLLASPSIIPVVALVRKFFMQC